ncbi:class I SAM-dependent methyltransferase [Aminobacter niigataensis]|uniref:Methyltransferase domain-containing protein n=1 Tax=Aminobacter niigataensis TaxID=83265 RepID=A0ABR6KX66_9HYPH|nr:methyltransferase domain-containing protein [Aminobacter niigataensis]MBB4649026.1 hypothetical protein [Aminobacter niigataensis]
MLTAFDEWSGVANGSQPFWESRAQIIAKLIRATDSVLDIGAGNRKLSRFIPKTCEYTPVDCVADLPGTFVVDFNQDFQLPGVNFDVVVCAGFLEYLDDVPAFFRQMALHAPGRQIIFTYLFHDRKMRRTEMCVHNDFPTSQAMLGAICTYLSHVDVFAFDRETAYYNATLSSGETIPTVNPVLITELLAIPESAPMRFIRRMNRSIKKRLP